MSMDALLACVRQTEAWSRFQNDGAALRRTRLLAHAILATRRKFFPDTGGANANDDVTKRSSSPTGSATPLTNVTRDRGRCTSD
jgi:hypothetical protein